MSNGGGDENRRLSGDLATVLGEIPPAVVASVEPGNATEALERAMQAHEEYDYEAAYDYYKLAVLFAGGEAEATCRLVTFLVDDYAIFDDAIRLLESGACQASPASRQLLARAQLLAGNRVAALAAYQRLNDAGEGDSASWMNQGKLLLESGDAQAAHDALSSAIRLDGRNAEAQRLLEQASSAVAEQLTPVLEQAQRALDAGQLDGALAILEEISGGAALPAAYHRLRALVEKGLAASRLEQYLDRGLELTAAGDLAGALAAFRQALSVDPGCELAQQQVDSLSVAMERAAGANWLVRGDEAFGAGDLDAAIHGYYMAVTRAPDVTSGDGAGQGLLTLVREFREAVGKVPEKAQIAGISALFKAGHLLHAGDFSGARLEVRRSGSLAELLPSGKELVANLAAREQAVREARAGELFDEACRLEADGELSKALARFEQVARVEGFDQAPEAARRARSLAQKASDGAARSNAFASLEALLDEQQFFLAVREIGKNRVLLGEQERVEELLRQAQEGARQKFPVVVEVQESHTARQRFPVAQSHDFVPDRTRFLQTMPGSSEYFAVAGRTLFVVDPSNLQVRVRVELPEQADLTDKKGFILADVTPGDRAGMVVVNFDDDQMLYFQYRRNQFDLANVLPIERFLQQSRRKVTRWYTLNGPQEQIVICQSPQGGGGETRIYGLSLLDGRIEHDDEFGYPLANLRRIPGGDSRYVIHRLPEPVLMRRPGYFSMMFMDARLRVTERLNLGPEDLEGTFIESTRWLRTGNLSQNRYFLFRYYDMYSGQLVGRPLAFVALDSRNEILYAAPDSSTLVGNLGDLDAIGELFVHDGKEHLAILGRKENQPYLFVVDMSRFRMVEKHRLDPERHYVGLVPTEREGTFGVVSLGKQEGGLLLEAMEVV